jgi:DNA mismatch repair protein MutL
MLNDGLNDQSRDKDPIEAKIRKVAARLACHASLRGKMQCPDRDQLAALLRQLKDCEDPHLCPHGRPTKITINHRELLRMFRRL